MPVPSGPYEEVRDERHRRSPRRWFRLDRLTAVWKQCAACGNPGVASRQPLELVAFCSDCLERGAPAVEGDIEETGVGD